MFSQEKGLQLLPIKGATPEGKGIAHAAKLFPDLSAKGLRCTVAGYAVNYF